MNIFKKIGKIFSNDKKCDHYYSNIIGWCEIRIPNEHIEVRLIFKCPKCNEVFEAYLVDNDAKQWIESMGAHKPINRQTLVVSAFPACGKSYLINRFKNSCFKVLDSDSSEYHFMMKDGKKIQNPEWPHNYIKHIKEQIGKVDLILVSSHAEIRHLLKAHDIKYSVVVPHNDINIRHQWIGRMYERGNSPEFIKKVVDNWSNWLADIPGDDLFDVADVYYLNESEYLSDLIRVDKSGEHLIIKYKEEK